MSTPLGTAVGTSWPGVVDGHLQVGDRRLRVLRAPGRHGAGPGEPQLLVHGLGGSAVTWVEVMHGLAARGPVVAIDLPGFGRTPVEADDDLTIDSYAELVVAVLDALRWSSATLHGNSMGGLVATLVAAAHPDRVSRLVLVSPAFPPRVPLRLLLPTRTTVATMAPLAASSGSAAALGLLGAVPRGLDRRNKRALLGLIFGAPDDVNPALLDLMAREYTPGPGRADAEEKRRALLSALRSITRSWVDPRRVWRAIDAVQAPTLVLGGTADALVPAHVLRQVLVRRPTWEGHVLTDRRHALMMESPAEYLELLDDWYEPVAA